MNPSYIFYRCKKKWFWSKWPNQNLNRTWYRILYVNMAIQKSWDPSRMSGISIAQGKTIILQAFFREYPTNGQMEHQRQVLWQCSYLVIIAVRKELLPCCIFQKTSLRRECKLRKEVGSRRLLCCGLKGKVTWLHKRLQGRPPKGQILKRTFQENPEFCIQKREVPYLGKDQGEAHQAPVLGTLLDQDITLVFLKWPGVELFHCPPPAVPHLSAIQPQRS